MIDFPASPAMGQQFTAAGSTWQWDGGKWVPGPPASAANVGRNLIHNSMFRVQQRGATGFNANGGAVAYTADRWFIASAIAADVVGAQMVAHTDASRAAIGDESARWILSTSFTGGGTNSAINVNQRIEDVRRMAGRTVTVSFYASGTAGVIIGLTLVQFFGTGGSPSPNANAGEQYVTLSTTWTRYVLTFAVPSVAGKTFGTTLNTDYTSLVFYCSQQGNATVGNQSGGLNLWGVQVEIGSVATPLEKPDLALELTNCQRFYQQGAFSFWAYNLAGAICAVPMTLLTQMRVSPTLVLGTPSSSTNVSSPGLAPYGGGGGNGARAAQLSYTATATGATQYANTFTASADL